MVAQGFGEFLVEKGVITKEIHTKSLDIQSKNRLLGEIAIELNYITRDNLPQVIEHIEKNRHMKFGEAAVSLGLINTNQLRYLLDIRTRRKIPLGELLVEHNFIDEETMLKALMSFNQESHTLEKILVVDDSSIIQKLLERMVVKYGYQAFATSSGKKALDLVNQEKPDILIVGGTLSDMGGLKLCHNIMIQSKTPVMNIVYISSDDKESKVREAFEKGVNHFLKMPIIEKELINVIYQIEKEISQKRPEKILVVDDSRGARLVISRELTKAGFQVYQAENGKEGVKKAMEIIPDIITMDVEMPKMDGFEACKALKDNESTHDIPVIMISSIEGLEVREKGFHAGAAEYFNKPFKGGRLATYIDMLLETKKIRKNEKVLVVEDSNVTRHILKYTFSKNGYVVYTAKNADEALALLPECFPDLIVTDCFMPGMDGFELTKKIKGMEDYRHIPVIMLTGAVTREEMLKGLAAGAGDYLTKPFDEAELIARSGTHLTNKMLMDEIKKDRDELQKAKEQLLTYSKEMEKLARTDPLTGSFNRRYFLELAEQELLRAYRYKKPMSLLVLDIDHFKSINDKYGHLGGDRTIKKFVDVSMRTLRASDIFCRYGGEEFAAILVETGIDEAAIIAERLRANLDKATVDFDGRTISFTASVGLSTLELGDGRVEPMLGRADVALYKAKNSGRNRVELG